MEFTRIGVSFFCRHLSFVTSCARLFADIYGIAHSKNDLESVGVKEFLQTVNVPPFVPKIKVWSFFTTFYCISWLLCFVCVWRNSRRTSLQRRRTRWMMSRVTSCRRLHNESQRLHRKAVRREKLQGIIRFWCIDRAFRSVINFDDVIIFWKRRWPQRSCRLHHSVVGESTLFHSNTLHVHDCTCTVCAHVVSLHAVAELAGADVRHWSRGSTEDEAHCRTHRPCNRHDHRCRRWPGNKPTTANIQRMSLKVRLSSAIFRRL